MTAIRGALKSRIVYLSLAVGVLGVLQSNMSAIAPFIPPKYLGLLDIGLAIALVVARFFTTESLAEKGEKTPEDSDT